MTHNEPHIFNVKVFTFLNLISCMKKIFFYQNYSIHDHSNTLLHVTEKTGIQPTHSPSHLSEPTSSSVQNDL